MSVDLSDIEIVDLCIWRPQVSREILVEITADDNGGGHGVEHGEDADANHQFFQFVAARAVVLDNFTNAKESGEAGDDEGRPQNKIDAERREHKSGQRWRVLRAYEADSRQFVTVDFLQNESDDGLDEWNEPGHKMVVESVPFYCFISPLHSGGEKPGESQDYPPGRCCHEREVENHEDDCTTSVVCVALDENLDAAVFATCDVFVTGS